MNEMIGEVSKPAIQMATIIQQSAKKRLSTGFPDHETHLQIRWNHKIIYQTIIKIIITTITTNVNIYANWKLTQIQSSNKIIYKVDNTTVLLLYPTDE